MRNEPSVSPYEIFVFENKENSFDLKAVLLSKNFGTESTGYSMRANDTEPEDAFCPPEWLSRSDKSKENMTQKKIDSYLFGTLLWTLYSGKLPYADIHIDHIDRNEEDIKNWAAKMQREGHDLSLKRETFAKASDEEYKAVKLLIEKTLAPADKRPNLAEMRKLLGDIELAAKKESTEID